MFTHRVSGKTPVTRTSGTHVASESLKGRVFTVSLADLAGSEDLDYRKIKLVGEEVQGKVRPRAVSCAVVVVLSFGRPRATPRSAPPLPPRSCC
jgi:hypothetical protein